MKTIAEHMKDILIENDYESVGFGDLYFLDECAYRSSHTKLHSLPTYDRHIRILNALEKSPLFEKGLVKNENKTVRHFWLKSEPITNKENKND